MDLILRAKPQKMCNKIECHRCYFSQLYAQHYNFPRNIQKEKTLTILDTCIWSYSKIYKCYFR